MIRYSGSYTTPRARLFNKRIRCIFENIKHAFCPGLHWGDCKLFWICVVRTRILLNIFKCGIVLNIIPHFLLDTIKISIFIFSKNPISIPHKFMSDIKYVGLTFLFPLFYPFNVCTPIIHPLNNPLLNPFSAPHNPSKNRLTSISNSYKIQT